MTQPGRPLGHFERAFLRTADYSPINVVGVLRLNPLPDEDLLREAIQVMAQHHPLLTAVIRGSGSSAEFVPGQTMPTLVTRPRLALDWRIAVEREISEQIDRQEGPLVRFTRLSDKPGQPGELIITAHHVVIDGVSATRLLHDMLQLCANPESAAWKTLTQPRTLIPPLEGLLPARMKRPRRWPAKLQFMARQMASAICYQRDSRTITRLEARASATNRIFSFHLDASLCARLNRRRRKEKVTLYNILLASILIAFYRFRTLHGQVPLRYIAFHDLRPYLVRPIDGNDLGLYIAMLRHTASLDDQTAPWELARFVQDQMYRAARRGDKFIAPLMMDLTMKALLRFRYERMGDVAFSFTGPLQLEATYGPYHLMGVHAFVGNLGLGPMLAVQARQFQGKVWFDFLYLAEDMSEPDIQAIAESLEALLSVSC